jgi:hypothetical protein
VQYANNLNVGKCVRNIHYCLVDDQIESILWILMCAMAKHTDQAINNYVGRSISFHLDTLTSLISDRTTSNLERSRTRLKCPILDASATDTVRSYLVISRIVTEESRVRVASIEPTIRLFLPAICRTIICSCSRPRTRHCRLLLIG